MTKCLGCGAVLQNKNINDIGYVTNLDSTLCTRCFRIKNYNEYKIVEASNKDYLKILESVNKTNDLVLLVIDIFDIPSKLNEIRNVIKNDLILVINKRDILPSSIYDVNIINYFKRFNLQEKDIILISSKKNTNLDELFDLIKKYQKSKNIYVVGYTNAGKSSLINKLIYNYADNKDCNITVSNMPSTTIDTIKVKLNDNLVLNDTPGLLNEDSIINKIDGKELKHIIPTSVIKPRVYQIKCPQHIILEDYIRIDLNDSNDLVFYVANNLNIERVFKDTNKLIDQEKITLQVYENNDIVLVGLGFIKVKKSALITIYVAKNIKIEIRNSMI